MANNVLLLSNAAAPGTALLIPLVVAKQGSFTADQLETPAGVFPFDVEIVNVVGGVLTCGVDGTDPLSVQFDVKTRAVAATSGTSVVTTKASIGGQTGGTGISAAAGTGFRSTASAATGVVPVVLDSTKTTVAAGSLISVDFDITRTTPETEFAGPFAVVWCAPLGGADTRTYGDFVGL